MGNLKFMLAIGIFCFPIPYNKIATSCNLHVYAFLFKTRLGNN